MGTVGPGTVGGRSGLRWETPDGWGEPSAQGQGHGGPGEPGPSLTSLPTGSPDLCHPAVGTEAAWEVEWGKPSFLEGPKIMRETQGCQSPNWEASHQAVPGLGACPV